MTMLAARAMIFSAFDNSAARPKPEPIVRQFPERRRRPPLRVHTSAAPLGIEAARPTAIHFASVDAVHRALGDGKTLDAVELACGETYRQKADRERFFAARMLLRHALSKAVGGEIPPAEWRYLEGPHGKPIMAGGLPALEFNVSHSGNCVAVAVSPHAPVGIDIECAEPNASIRIVDDVLNEGERMRLKGVPESRQWPDFVRLWTAKEACAKALGRGLSLDFSTIDVLLDPLRVRLLDPPVGASADFHVASTTLTKGGTPYVMTVAKLIGESATRPAPAKATRAPSG